MIGTNTHPMNLSRKEQNEIIDKVTSRYSSAKLCIIACMKLPQVIYSHEHVRGPNVYILSSTHLMAAIVRLLYYTEGNRKGKVPAYA